VPTLPRTVLLSLSAKAETADAVVDPAYWLSHADGFRVDGPNGRIGTVLRSSESTRTLTLRVGLFRSRELRVGFADVEDVRPRQQRLVLQSDPRFTRIGRRRTVLHGVRYTGDSRSRNTP
jgi:hypothetical protein